jgi:hypothetical protein
MLSEKQYFIQACFSNNLQDFYTNYINEKKGRSQLFDTSNSGELIHKYWKPSNICCVSGAQLTERNIDIKISYWTPFIWKPIHKDLKQSAMKIEALSCQEIDMSCNDCAFLIRSEKHCSLLNKEVTIVPNTSHPQNINCFKHRTYAK